MELQVIFVIPNGRIRLIQLSLGVLVLVSKFRLLGVDEFNIYGSVHHALYGEISPTRCGNCVFYSQWLYSTCFR